MMKTTSALALLLATLSTAPAAQAASLGFNGLGAKPPITATPVAEAKPPVHVPVLINLPSNPPGSGGWDEPSDAPDSHDDPSDPPGGSDGGENTDPAGGDQDGNPFTP